MSAELNNLSDTDKTALKALVQAHKWVLEAKADLRAAEVVYAKSRRKLSEALCYISDGETVISELPEVVTVNHLDNAWLVRLDFDGEDNHTIEMLGGTVTL